jgi:transcriptional regulator GlxA family with amidase domain
MQERRVIVVGYDDVELLDVACVTTTLAMANRQGADPAYLVQLASSGGREMTCDAGVGLRVQEALERVRGPLDTLIVSGGLGHGTAAADVILVGHVRRLARESRRVASVCTGAAVLAAAGLLNGKRATTHWMFAQQLAADYPDTVVDPAPIYIRDGKISTAAGVTSALDLTLAFVEEDHGAELARTVARMLVTYMQRPGNQAQMSMFTNTTPPRHALIRQITDHIAANLAGDLSTATLATAASVSERHLARLFTEDLGQTPGRFVRQARVEAAAHLLSSDTQSLSSVAATCGFASAETLRQAFVSRYGVPPSRYRATQTTQRRTQPALSADRWVAGEIHRPA